MKTLQRATAFLVNSNCWIALCAALSTKAFYLDKQTVANSTLLFVFSGTLLIYCAHSLKKSILKKELAEGNKHTFALRHKKTLYFLVGISFAYASYFLLKNPIFIKFIALPSSIGLAYFLPFIPWKGKRYGLRDIPYIKNLLVAAVWTYVSTCLILLVNEKNLTSSYFLLFTLSRFALFFILSSLADFKDLSLDSPSLRTLPMRVGIPRAKMYYYLICLVIVALLTYLHQVAYLNKAQFLSFLASQALLLVLIFFATKNSKPLYYNFLSDGVLAVPILIQLYFS